MLRGYFLCLLNLIIGILRVKKHLKSDKILKNKKSLNFYCWNKNEDNTNVNHLGVNKTKVELNKNIFFIFLF